MNPNSLVCRVVTAVCAWVLLAGAAFAATPAPVEHMSLDAVLALPEPDQRNTFWRSARSWFTAENFAQIEESTETVRSRKLRKSSGLWVIGLLQGGVDSAPAEASWR